MPDPFRARRDPTVSPGAPLWSSLPARRLALFYFFFLPGISLSSWVTRTPDFRDLTGSTIADMGFTLFGLSVGSMAGILSSTALNRRLGAHRAILISTILMIGGIAVLAVASAIISSPVAAAGLLLFGAGMGASEVAINTEGTALEALLARPILSSLHAGFSLGTMTGALAGVWFTAAAVPLGLHFTGLVLVTLPLTVLALRATPPGTTARRTPADRREAGSIPRPAGSALWHDRRLLLIGVLVLGMALAEGSANDWLPLVMVDGHGLDPSLAAFAYVGFAAAMTAGRLSGMFLLRRFSRVAVIRGCIGVAAAGVACVVFAEIPLLAGCAVMLWGLGASLGFPLAISAAGDASGDAAVSAAHVGAVVTAGYLAFLVGPPLLGMLGDGLGLRTALLVVLGLLLLALLAAPAVSPPHGAAEVVRSQAP